MAKINKTKYAILGVLSLMPCSGYDIKKFCDNNISHFWSENYGHIYPVLKQLESEKSIKKHTEYTEGKPPRNIYKLTEKGRTELIEWLVQPVENQPPRFELLLKMFFSRDIPLENVLVKLVQVKEESKKTLQEYLKTEETLKKNDEETDEKNIPFWMASIRYGIYDARARINWCDETIKNLTDIKEGQMLDDANG